MKLYDHAIRLNNARQELKGKIEAIKQDDRYSSEYKKILIKQVQSEYVPVFQSYQDDFESDLTKLTDRAKEKEPAFDFNDSRIINAISMLNAMKEKTPESVTDSIIKTFKDNVPALRVILPYLEEYHLTMPAMDISEIVRKPTPAERLQNLEDYVHYSAVNTEQMYSPERLKEFSQIDAELTE